MALGEKLKMLRASRGLSQEQLAAELDVSRQAISKWECGDSTPDLYAWLSGGSVVDVERVCGRGRLADRLGERRDLAAA